jgi:alpha-D-xyloside xylohydrolase
VDDEYLFGSDLLVAPLLESGTARAVYLPPGQWIDYQTWKAYVGGWNRIQADHIPAVILVRDGAVIPHITLAQSTASMDWSYLGLIVYTVDSQNAQGLVCVPSEGQLHKVVLTRQGDQFRLTDDPLAGKVRWAIHRASKN